jgi:hypothetical protein
MKGVWGRTAAIAGILAVVASTVTGCVTTTGGIAAASTSQDDVCYQQRIALDESQSFLKEDLVKMAAMGAVVGAAGGFLAGGNIGSAIKGAVIGAAGAAIATAYWDSLQQQKVSGSTLYSKMNGDMTRELEGVNKTQAAYNDLAKCRKAQETRVRGDFLSGKLNREQGNAELAKVHDLALQDYDLAVRINSKVKSRTENFAYATQKATGKSIPKSSRATISGTPAADEAGSLQCCSALQASNTNFEQALNNTKPGDFKPL